MKRSPTSILVISNDEAIECEILKSLSESDSAEISTKRSSVSAMNGSASSIIAGHDIVVFSPDTNDEEELVAIKKMSEVRAPNAVFFALAGDDIPLSKARELTRCGIDEVFPKSSLDNELTDQIATWRARREAMLPAIWTDTQTKGKVITVAQARGGVGSTTVAVNLADQLLNRSRFRKKNENSVIVVDLDFQFGTVGTLLDVEEGESLLKVAMEGFVPDKDFLDQCITTLPSSLAVLPSPSKFGPLEALRPEQVRAILETLRAEYDYVVVDLPRALVKWIEPVLELSDDVLLVSDLTVPSVRASRRLIDFFKEEQPSLKIDVIVNFEKKPMVRASHHREAARVLEQEFVHWLPKNDRAARETLDQGKPISMIAPRSDLARSFKKLARETIRKLSDEVPSNA